MKATHVILAAFAATATLVPATAGARSAYLEQAKKQLQLETSNSTRVDCRYCHVSQFGGAPWNPFGDEVRQNFLGPAKRNIAQALYLTLKANDDADGDGYPDVLEVVAKTFPGDAKSKPTQSKADLEAELKKLGGVDHFKAP